MLATYHDAESTAVFHYCRSILAKQPFSGGLQNLAKVFAHNVDTYRSLQRQYRGDPSIRFKHFLTSYVRLHSLLFTWSIDMHLDYLHTHNSYIQRDEILLIQEIQKTLKASNTNNKGNMQLTPTAVIAGYEKEEEEFFNILDELLRDLDLLIYYPKLSDLHLLRLAAIGIFSVHFAENPMHASTSGNASANTNTTDSPSFLFSLSSIEDSAPGTQNSNSNNDHDEVVNRTKIQSYALVALFKVITRYVEPDCQYYNSTINISHNTCGLYLQSGK
jgi:hypothetical protein